MRTRTALCLLPLMVVSLTVNALGGGDGWLRDYKQAVKKAAAKKVPILVDFSGSDWCGWCIKLDKEVFTQKAFKDYAKGDLVLFIADFPRRKQLPKREKEQNEKLMAKHKVRGFPTVLLVDHQGKVLARTGYRKGGADGYVKHLKRLIADAKKKKADT